MGTKGRFASSPQIIVIVLALFSGAARVAHARDFDFRYAGGSPDDLITVPTSRPMSGFSLLAGLGTRLAHRAADTSTGAAERYGAGADALLAVSLFGWLQLDAALPVRYDISLPTGGSATTSTALEGVRLDLRFALPGLRRAAGESGAGAAVIAGFDLPTAYPEAQAMAYRPGLVVDGRWNRLHLSAYSAVPLQAASDRTPLMADLVLGGAVSVDLCLSCRLSLTAVLDGWITLAGPPTSGERGGARGLLGFRWLSPGGFGVELSGGASLAHLDTSGFDLAAKMTWVWGAAQKERMPQSQDPIEERAPGRLRRCRRSEARAWEAPQPRGASRCDR